MSDRQSHRLQLTLSVGTAQSLRGAGTDRGDGGTRTHDEVPLFLTCDRIVSGQSNCTVTSKVLYTTFHILPFRSIHKTYRDVYFVRAYSTVRFRNAMVRNQHKAATVRLLLDWQKHRYAKKDFFGSV